MAEVAILVPFDPVHLANPSNATQPPLRLACLAATTRALGHRVTAIDGVGRGLGQRWTFGRRFHLHGLRIPELVAAVPAGADVIGVSMMFTQTYPPVRELLRQLRASHPRAAILLGGEGVTGIADVIVRETPVDGVIVGEGEGPWIRCLGALEAGESIGGIPNVVTSTVPYADARAQRDDGGIDHLDRLPRPDWSDVPLDRYWKQQKIHAATAWSRYLPMAASRGCPFQCRFCTAPATWGSQRYRSAEDVVDEMRGHVRDLGIEFFSFNDLSMTTKMSWFDGYVDHLIDADLGAHWAVPAGIRASRLSRDLLQRAKRSGMSHLQIAPETGSSRVLAWIDKRFEHDSVLDTIVNAKSVGLPVCAYIIVGHPVEEMDDYLQTLRFLVKLAELGVDEIAVSAFTPLPGSPYFNELLARGEITFDDDFYSILAQGDLALKVSVSPHFSGSEIRAMRLQTLLWFYGNRFAQRPGDLVSMFGRVLRNDQQTKLDRVFRYELPSLVRGFAPLLTPTSLGVLASVAGHLARRRGRAPRRAAATD